MTTFTPPQQFSATLQEKTELNSKFNLFKFELVQPHRLQFLAGQYVSIKINDQGERRAYSICSNPATDHSFELLIDVSKPGLGVNYLQHLKLGDPIEILAPLGRFVIESSVENSDSSAALVFVATGSGVAPLRSMILDLLQNHQDQRKIILHWGLHEVSNLIWQDEFQELCESFPNFAFHPVLSSSPAEWILCRGHVTDCLEIHPLQPNATYYLCGAQDMIVNVTKLLVSKGVDSSLIHHEQFN